VESYRFRPVRGSKKRVILERRVLIGIVLLFLVLMGVVFGWGFYARDLRGSYLVAARGVWRGEWRYWENDVWGPPWVVGAFMVVSWMPDEVVQGLWFVGSLAGMGWCCWKAELGIIDALLFMVSPPVVYMLAMGQVDWMVLVGMWLPGIWGYVGLLSKPQMGIGVAAVRAKGEWKAVLALSIGLLALISVPLIGQAWSLGIRPRGLALIVGGMVFSYALEIGSVELASVASLLITPYFTLGSLSLPLLLFGRKRRGVLILANVFGWLVLIVTTTGLISAW
jgi:hypothetical protein